MTKLVDRTNGQYTIASREKVIANGREKYLPGASPREGELLIREQISSHGHGPLNRGEAFFAIVPNSECRYWVARSVGKPRYVGSESYTAMYTYIVCFPASAEIVTEAEAKGAKVVDWGMHS